VFPRAAEVSRISEIKLPSGDHTVILRDLPARLLADSVRIEGEATGELEIGSVDTKRLLLPEDASATAERRRIEQEIERLGDEQSALSDRIAAAEAQKTLIRNLAKLPEQPGPRDQAQGARSPADWAEISSLIARQMTEAQREIREANVAMRKVQQQINDLQRELAGIPPRRIQRTEVRVNVSAASDLDATLTITYQVADASWVPIYEARLSTGDDDTKPALELTRRARVSQRTGEEWKDVRLTLSTTQPRQGTSAPGVESLRVEFRPKLVPRKLQRKFSDELSEAMPSATVIEKESDSAVGGLAAAKPKRQRIKRREAQISEAPFQANYAIPGRHTIPTDGAVRRIEVDRIGFAPKLIVRAVPRKRTAAYLYTELKIPEGQRLLPGAASLFRDGVFVGRGALPTLTSGETHEMGFGQDDTVRVEHVTLTQKTGESGIISTNKTDTRQFRTTITNGHKRAITVRVLDQLPVSGDEDIKAIMASGTTAPTIRDLDDKLGVLAWDFSLAPQAQKVINFGYRLAWPEGKEIRLREVRKKKRR
ncbi:MAG: mucoidy inhibitor MuiA family protein, partial [Hyphomicrobiaceae bacterium]